MQLTDQQLADVKDNYLALTKTIREWMNDNQLGTADIAPQQIVVQLKAKYGDETILPLMVALRQANFGRQFSQMAGRMCQRPGLTVELCDTIISHLQDALVTVQAKKTELQGG